MNTLQLVNITRAAAGLPPVDSLSPATGDGSGAPAAIAPVADPVSDFLALCEHAVFVREMARLSLGDLVLRLAAPPGEPLTPQTTESGAPVRRFLKEIARVGQYVKASEAQEFSIDRPLLKHWEKVFGAMQAAGVRVPCPVGHTDDVEANRGWVESMTCERDSLFATIALVGDGALELAGRSDVSIYSPVEFIDGKGNRYERPIMHVALCTDPVLPELEPFTLIDE